MPRPFPDRFDPAEWQGPRARTHPKREDAFQQLVGHAAQELFGLRAHVATTAGRDGSIDIFIEDDPVGAPAIQGWRLLPVVLECKDHDESGRDLAKNIQAGWSTVRERLARNAEAGWSGDYKPWTRARSYLYCISSRLPGQAARDDLREQIRAFFQGLPEEKRPPLEDFAVLDWSDLRGWLDTLPGVADAWLGIEAPSIVGHEQFLQGLVGFRSYLLPEKLPYVAPAADAATHPDRLFEQLAKEDTSGVLLAGVGGVGKTRLAVEVASRAAAAGWRVLHAGAGDSDLEVDTLAAVALGQGSRTLIVLDYLEQMHHLDPGAVRHRLLPEARRRGESIVLLAIARPGAAVLDHPEWGSLLATVTLAPPKELVEVVTERMRETLAPRAETILGKERLRQLCGSRPILTLFLARELERRASEGLLEAATVADLREGDLLQWLRLRLQENGILVPSVHHRLVPPDPEAEVVAAAAALAAAPLRRDDLISVAAAALGDRAHLAEALIENLAAFGWLEPSPWEWSTAHDVVADEVLEQVLRLRPGTSVRSHALRMLLASSLRIPRALGRFALALRRLILASAADPVFVERLAEASCEWLQSHEQELASVLAVADPDVASYALGSVLAGSPWDELAFDRWDALVGPWLDHWKEKREARHLLYIGLSRKEAASERLVEAAAAWLAVHYSDFEASFILGPLLGRAGLGGRSEEAIDRGLSWLSRFAEEKEAQFVLRPLLGRVNLGKSSEEAIDRGLSWLSRFAKEKEAGFVLDPLLGREDLGKRSEEAIDRGLFWLSRFAEEKEARFVLHPLLGRTDLGKRSEEAIDRGLSWLSRFPEEKEADFVLPPLLGSADLGKRSEEAIDRGLSWLSRFAEEKEANFVLPPLLGRTDLGKRLEEAIDRGLSWLSRFPEEKEAGFVLLPLLGRADLGKRSEEAIDRGLSWLSRFPEEKEARFVLPPLLGRKELSPTQRVATVSLALDWLDRWYALSEPDFIFKNLFKLKLDSLALDRCVRLALQRAEALPLDFSEASFLLEWVLSYKDLTGAEETRAFQRGMAWCRLHPLSSDAKFLFKPILRRKSLSDEDWSRAARLALDWLRNTPYAPDRDFLLRSCLDRPHLLANADLNFLRQDILAWCQAYPDAREVAESLIFILRRMELRRFGDAEALQRRPSVTADDLLHWFKQQQAAGPPVEILEAGIAEARSRLLAGRAGSARHYLAPLLPLTARWGNEAQAAEVRELTRSLLNHPGLQAAQRAGFVRGSLMLLEGGVWADSVESGRQILRELGVTEEALDPHANSADPGAPGA